MAKWAPHRHVASQLSVYNHSKQICLGEIKLWLSSWNSLSSVNRCSGRISRFFYTVAVDDFNDLGHPDRLQKLH